MHLFAGPTGENGWGVYDTFFQHLTLRTYDRENSRWYSGADLLADYEFRDVGFNRILYSVRETAQSIVPDAALEDFGLTPEGIETWSVNTAKGLKLRIRPITMPTPSSVPDDWGIKGSLAVLVKAVVKFPDSDPTPIKGWLDASGHHFRHDVQRNRTRRRSAEQVLASYSSRRRSSRERPPSTFWLSEASTARCSTAPLRPRWGFGAEPISGRRIRCSPGGDFENSTRSTVPSSSVRKWSQTSICHPPR